MPNDVKRIQVPMTRVLRDKLRDWAAEVAKERDEESGTGSIAAEILEAVIKNPALVHRLLFEGESPGPPESPPKENRRPVAAKLSQK